MTLHPRQIRQAKATAAGALGWLGYTDEAAAAYMAAHPDADSRTTVKINGHTRGFYVESASRLSELADAAEELTRLARILARHVDGIHQPGVTLLEVEQAARDTLDFIGTMRRPS